MPGHPFPDLQVHPTSGLSFPWAEYHPGQVVGSFDAHLGTDGVGLGMNMLILWSDLVTACQEILGYSWRDSSVAPSRLRRVLPWQHPYMNQLRAKAISRVQGIRIEGNSIDNPGDDVFSTSLGNAGLGYHPNTGPWSEFHLAQLTISFWRPPYFVRSDQDIEYFGEPQEWLRYVDKNWELDTQMLSREGSTFMFARGQGLDGRQFQGSVGQKLQRVTIKRRWYQIPEAALFDNLVDLTPNGLPLNFLQTQTGTYNPVTNYYYPPGSPISCCVNSPIGGGTDDTDPELQFFGCPIGTLLYLNPEFQVQPLHLPPALMQIPGFDGNEPISQVQYDVVLKFDYFDPPRVSGTDVDTVGGKYPVFYVRLTNGGSGWSDDPDKLPPSVVFSAPGGGGVTATGVGVVSGTKVAAIALQDAGSGYTSAPTVTITDPNVGGTGTGATAKAYLLKGLPKYNWRGHNLMPFSGNGFWFAVQSQQGPVTTPFQYADFTDLFQIL